MEDAPLSAPEVSLGRFVENLRARMTEHESASLTELLDNFKRTTYGRGYVQGGRDANYVGQPS